MLYIPPHFRDEDPAALRAFIDARPFATLITQGADEIDVSFLPLLLAGDKLIGHLARANPQWQRLQAGAPAVALFQGADAYVSPGYYPSKAEQGRVVPTWNYSVVQAVGALEVFDSAERLLALVTRLTEQQERQRQAPWAVSDAPAPYIAQQLRGIVGVEMSIQRLEGKRKLSQNRSAPDQAGVIKGLTETGDAQSLAVAADMQAR